MTILVCPNCHARYQIAQPIKPPGRKVRCGKCANVWFAAAGTGAPPAAPAPIMPDLPDASKQPVASAREAAAMPFSVRTTDAAANRKALDRPPPAGEVADMARQNHGWIEPATSDGHGHGDNDLAVHGASQQPWPFETAVEPVSKSKPDLKSLVHAIDGIGDGTRDATGQRGADAPVNRADAGYAPQWRPALAEPPPAAASPGWPFQAQPAGLAHAPPLDPMRGPRQPPPYPDPFSRPPQDQPAGRRAGPGLTPGGARASSLASSPASEPPPMPWRKPDVAAGSAANQGPGLGAMPGSAVSAQAPPPARAKSVPGPAGRAARVAGRILSLLLVAATVTLAIGLWVGRETVVRTQPGMAPVYAILGADVNARGLELRKIKTEWITGEGPVELEVKGEVHNVSDDEQKVPSVVLAFRSEAGETLVQWTAKTGSLTVSRGGFTRFTARVAQPPAGVASLLVRFAKLD